MSTYPPGRPSRRTRDTRVRQGAHRTGRTFVAALTPSLLAVAAVASLITALAVWQAEEPDRPAAVASASTRSPSPTVPTPTPTPTPSSTPTAEAGPSETAASESAQATESAASSEAPAGLEVVVLNQTSRGGLAGSVAETLRRAGWEVPAVGNFRGVVPSTTVYYPAGAEGDAMAVAEDLPTEPRVRPRFGNLSTSRLTVVVTNTYPG
jgi:hypothetical protein